ncbi:MAG: iron-sulfur cluster-binding protein [Gammaproteobacteria bacterium]|nr:iron-sulfur cluster-binding protein [Gammaproteobacteria bacterium]
MPQTEAFAQRINKALANNQARLSLRVTMDRLKLKRQQQFPDKQQLNALRHQAKTIRQNALNHLPELLEQLEEKLTENGIQVHWAETPDQANRIIHDILSKAGAKTVVKGKSMVSEEIDMNAHLEQHGIEVIESDLGEFIIQLAHEPPSHIIMPAIHKNARDVAKLFHQHFPELAYSEDVDELTLSARKILRNKFANADAGISGVNFAVAETGTLCLVENEGNGRLSTTAPELHIAITGIEKVIEKLQDLPPLLNILPKTATGQPITTYVNMISSPRKENEKDGPKAVHLVLLDNTRSDIHSSDEFIDTLRCIRCGSCINHCPVYVQVGGHAYGSTYPGPIGTVLEPQRIGLQQMGNLTSACTLCGACAEACPVEIPLPSLINQLRAESVNQQFSDSHITGKGSLRKYPEAITWKLWSFTHARPWLYGIFRWTATRLRFLTPSRLGGWTKYRTAPRPAPKTLHELARQQGFDNE